MTSRPSRTTTRPATTTWRGRRPPPSWTTFLVLPRRLDFRRAGAGLTPPSRTRFDRVDDGRLSYPVLP
ncbi:hypothetical protein [Pseudonocardia abyssalis]|uniref:Uncharacterized protein n=1 Tax=Pseudonocardia abyssalis TaxID=2792008 RepID=A0ABS6UTU3_9PSEU|nr:hypothetical protein [Pseudonocardia abyssalis]MBW0117972.1 hypothetical protein [Pseudonocardia abyssalis]MBW0135164.1 hypothetical protein [Pseudonocardia abyssalis]